MLARRQQGLAPLVQPLVAAWQRHGARSCSGTGVAAADADADAAKRERRKQRRACNRELKQRMGLKSFGFQLGGSQANEDEAQAASKKRGSSRGVSAGAPDPDSDWDVFSALFGRPRTASERRKFGRVWREWERAAEHARQSAAGSSGFASSWSGGGSRGSRHDLFDSSGDEREGSSQRGSAGSAGSGSWTKGSAGASAGPRWGQANWTWDDFRDPSASNRSHSRSWQEDFAAGFAAYEGWCDAEPPNQGRQRTGSGSSSSSAWGWRASGTSWQHDRSTWQHGGGGSATSMSVHGHLSVLGLGRSWLGTRCGKALRHAFLRKAKADHPDVHAAAGAGAVAAAKERFQAAQDAYAQLLVLVQA